MLMRRMGSALICSGLICVGLQLWGVDHDWPQWGGRDQSLKARSDLGLGRAPGVSLELLWQKPLGSGYSSVIVAEGRGICAASIGDGDYLVAFQLQDGQFLWRYRMADLFLGRAGSDDGPISTPVYENGVVYALHPGGDVAAISHADGKPLWRVSLVESLGAQLPTYGFSNALLVEGRILIVPLNIEGEATLAGLDKQTGAVVWKAGADKLGYQNPWTGSLAGTRQLVFAANRWIYGIRPEDGKTLWSHELRERDDASLVVPVDEQHFLYTGMRRSMLMRVDAEEGEFKPKILWEKNILKRNHCTPIYFQGHFYGFDGRFLACFDAGNGELKWKSRPPGGQTLSMVDDHLLMWDGRGALTVVAASPEGYLEKGHLALSPARRIYTPPTIVGNQVFLRDLKNLYAVRLDKAEAIAGKQEAPPLPDDEFGQFITQLKNAPDKKAMIEDFLGKHPRFPIVTDRGWVHFAFEGEAEDLAIHGDMTGFWPEEPMHKVEGTQFFYRSYQLEPNQRWHYRFKKYEEPLTDPRNPHTVETENGGFSVVERGDWPQPAYIQPAALAKRGTLSDVELTEPGTENKFAFSVYLPPKFSAESGHSYPLLVYTLGDQAIKQGNMIQTLDHLAGKSFQESIAVFFKFPEPIWFDGNVPRFNKLMTGTILPYLEANFPISKDPEKRVMVTRDWSARTVCMFVLEGLGNFGKLGLQSPLFTRSFLDRELKNLLEQHGGVPVYMDWGRYAGINHEWPVNVAEDCQRAAQLFRGTGKPVVTKLRSGGYNWHSWRNHSEQLLAALLPL